MLINIYDGGLQNFIPSSIEGDPFYLLSNYLIFVIDFTDVDSSDMEFYHTVIQEVLFTQKCYWENYKKFKESLKVKHSNKKYLIVRPTENRITWSDSESMVLLDQINRYDTIFINASDFLDAIKIEVNSDKKE